MAQFEGLTPGTWPLDASHTSAGSTIRHAGRSRVRGQFVELSGSLTVDEHAEDLRLEAPLQTASLTTRNADRDDHLPSAHFSASERAATDPCGTYRAGFTGQPTIARKEFGLTWNAALETGGVLVSDEVKISIEAEFTAPTAA